MRCAGARMLLDRFERQLHVEVQAQKSPVHEPPPREGMNPMWLSAISTNPELPARRGSSAS